MIKRIPEKPAFLFPGVGGEYTGFLAQLDRRQSEVLQEYRRVIRQETGLDLDRDDQGDKMFRDWIKLFTGDCLVYHTYQAWGIRPAVMMGYSMGLITALVCSRAFSFAAGLRLLKTIYEYSKCFAGKNQGMGVIIGKSGREVAQIIAANTLEKFVYIASENSDTCIVISGLIAELGQILQIAEQSGAIKVAAIKAPNAFHSPLAARGMESLVKLVGEMPVSDSEIPLLSLYNQQILHSAADLKRELLLNMSGVMKWKDSILKLGASGIDSFLEVSPDDALSRMSRVINLDYEFLTYQKIRRLQNF
ncbi:MAG: hypothetical protein APF81_03555 [Desulfosporosinus sp. BRH_c37]|nr:MAG: hypothetical protein APF81_03555 [Desulfosporosinus sp. BRH_c37]